MLLALSCRCEGIAMVGLRGERKVKDTALVRGSLNPDAAAGALDHLLANRQPHACPRVFGACVQALKQEKDALSMFRGNANTVILDTHTPDLALSFRPDM